jgi:hypothetical protein
MGKLSSLLSFRAFIASKLLKNINIFLIPNNPERRLLGWERPIGLPPWKNNVFRQIIVNYNGHSTLDNF